MYTSCFIHGKNRGSLFPFHCRTHVSQFLTHRQLNKTAFKIVLVLQRSYSSSVNRFASSTVLFTARYDVLLVGFCQP